MKIDPGQDIDMFPFQAFQIRIHFQSYIWLDLLLLFSRYYSFSAVRPNFSYEAEAEALSAHQHSTIKSPTYRTYS